MTATRRGPGRPEVGPRIAVRLPPELIDRIDQRAEEEQVPRAEVIRRTLDRHV